jgi:DNA-binding MarR family transcriptional regulator
MILVKQVGVYVNILNCRLKKYLAEVFKKNGVNLTAEQYLVMDTLWNEGTLTQQAIAFIIQKDKNSVTQFIDNLEKKGLVTRSVAKEDRRVNNIVVTAEGKALKDSTKQLAINTMEQALKDISEADLQTFVSVLKKVNANISDFGKNPDELEL